MEAGVVLDVKFNPIFWHLPNDRTGGILPDSTELWNVLWDNRGRLGGFAHSHPGTGNPQPSDTDVTTMVAIEAALGRRLVWWICSADKLISMQWQPSISKYRLDVEPEDVYAWVEKLREHSNY